METRQVWETLLVERYAHVNHMVVKFTTEDGRNWAHGFTEDYPAFVAAAYGVDMSDNAGAMDEIVDIILHQHHIPDPADPKNLETDAAAKQGMTAVLANHRDYPPGTVVPVTPFTAESPEQAREALMLRLAEVKENVVQYVPYIEVPEASLRSHAAQMYFMTEGEPPHPLQNFRNLSVVTEERMEKHRERIEAVRCEMLGLPIPPPREMPLARQAPVIKDPGIVRQSLSIYLNPVQGNPVNRK